MGVTATGTRVLCQMDYVLIVLPKKNRPPKPQKVVPSPPPEPPVPAVPPSPPPKPAPKPIELLPHLELIAKHMTKIRNSQPIHPTKSQKEIIKKIEDCIKNKETKIVISAPTGCGKSWLAVTLASAYGAVILTSTNDLQDQYCGTEEGLEEEKELGDFEFMNAVRGKRQYLCELSENTKKCDEAYCADCEHLVKNEDVTISRVGPLDERKVINSEKLLCKYYEADQVGKQSDYSVYSYASYIARMKADFSETEPGDKLPDKTVLVCDEAHDYDKVVSDCLLVKIDGELNRELIGKITTNLFCSRQRGATDRKDQRFY